MALRVLCRAADNNMLAVCVEALGGESKGALDETLVAQADYLITGDQDLLSLAERYPIVTPAVFWERHGSYPKASAKISSSPNSAKNSSAPTNSAQDFDRTQRVLQARFPNHSLMHAAADLEILWIYQWSADTDS